MCNRWRCHGRTSLWRVCRQEVVEQEIMRFRYRRCAGCIMWLYCRSVSPKPLLRLVVELLEDDVGSISDNCI
jgi:hypothetical protein